MIIRYTAKFWVLQQYSEIFSDETNTIWTGQLGTKMVFFYYNTKGKKSPLILSKKSERSGRSTWEEEFLDHELYPWGRGCYSILHTVVQQEGIQGQATRVNDGRHQVLGVVEEGQGTHVPVREASLLRWSSRQNPRYWVNYCCIRDKLHKILQILSPNFTDISRHF